MKTPIKIAAYAGILVVAFAIAFGVGNLTGGSIDATAEHDPEHASGSASDDDPHDAAGDHEDATGEHGGHDDEADSPVLASGLQVSESGYTLSPIDAPARASDSGTLRFQIVGPDGEPVTDFTESHEKDLHLIVVRTDTAHYRHVHPTIDADGIWSIDWAWDAAGTYKVFADFVPTELGDGLTLARTVDVGGKVDPRPLQADSRVAEVGDVTVSLDGDLAAGAGSELTATFERDGEPVTDLEPYLGAYGHLVALRAGDLGYVHVHPEGEPGDGVTEPGPEVTFHVEAPSAGTYRLFLDFQLGGEVRVAEFTVTADGAGDPAADGAADGDDTNGDHGDGDHGDGDHGDGDHDH